MDREPPRRSPDAIELQSPLYTFGQLCEASYLTRVFEELRALMGPSYDDYRFIVYSGPDSNNVDVRGGDSEKTVVLHISDETASIPYALCGRVRAVFKSYLPREGLVANLGSLPLGYVGSTPDLPPVPIGERRWNVFFSGNLNRRRLGLLRALGTPRISPVGLPPRVITALHPGLRFDGFLPPSYIRFTTGFRGGLSSTEYASRLVDSKVVLCPPGWNNAETFRHFEAMRAGAVLVSEPLPPLRFYTGSPIVTVARWRDARRVIRDLLASRDHLADLHDATLAWWRDVCSERATAATIAAALE